MTSNKLKYTVFNIEGITIRSLSYVIFLFLSFVNLAIIAFEWNRRSQSLFGISDEGYLFTQLINYDKSSLKPAPFSTILGPPFKWLNQSIVNYRLMGLTIVLVIGLTFFFLAVQTLKKSKSTNIASGISFPAFIAILLIPATFNYLLMSPGYQWLIAITSVLFYVILLALLLFQDNKLIKIICFLTLAFLLVINLYTRITVFFVSIVIILVIVSFLKDTLWRIALYVLGLIPITFIIVNQGLINYWIDIIASAKEIDAGGYSIVNETLDITRSIFLIIGALLLGRSIKILISQKNKKVIQVLLYFFLALFLTILWLQVTRTWTALLVLILTLVVGASCPLNPQIRSKTQAYFVLITVSFFPIYSQYGSNTSSMANSNLVLISVLLVFITNQIFYTSSLGSTFSYLSVILLIIALIQAIQLNKSYESTLNFETRVKVFGGELLTSNVIAGQIRNFQTYAEQENLDELSQILDLSQFHLGAGLFLGHQPLPLSTSDKLFENTFHTQLLRLLATYPFHLKNPNSLVLVTTPALAVEGITNACFPLKSWLAFEIKDIEELNIIELDLTFRTISLYSSSIEDKSLFPNVLRLLKKC